MFRVDSKQVGETFDTIEAAGEFVGWVDRFGGRDARQFRLQRSATEDNTDRRRVVPRARTRTVRHHRGHPQALVLDDRPEDRATPPRSARGQRPTRPHVAEWTQEEVRAGDSGKTILNCHGLHYAAMDTATSEGLRSGENPCKRSRIGNIRRAAEPVFLTYNEFTIVLTHIRSGGSRSP